MSLILDALKRAQGERQSLEARSSVELRDSTAVVQPNSSNLVLWVISGLLLAILILLWFLLRKDAPSEIKPITVIEPVALVEPKIQVASSSEQSVASSLVVSVAVNDLYQQRVASSIGVQQVQIAQLYAENDQLPSGEPQSVSVDNPLPDLNQSLPEPVQMTSEIRRLADLTNVIAFDDLTFNQKQQFPSINYSQHNYLGNSASSVVINGKVMRVGSRIAQDIVLDEILEDGVIFRLYRDPVSFKALNGWINM